MNLDRTANQLRGCRRHDVFTAGQGAGSQILVRQPVEIADGEECGVVAEPSQGMAQPLTEQGIRSAAVLGICSPVNDGWRPA